MFRLPGPESVKVGAYTLRVRVVVAVRLPEVPVTVSVLVPRPAVLLAVKISVLVFVVGFGVKLAVTPWGKPDTARFTLPLNPYAGITERDAKSDVPWPRVKGPGPVSVKLGPWMESDKVVVSVKLPETPVMVSVLVPTLAVLLAVRVSVLVPVVEVGENEALTPLGMPDRERLTLPVNPYWGETVIVEVAEPPWFSPTLLGEPERRKLGA
jgi:hypothetical protein